MKANRNVAVIQARMGSSRLAGKTLMDLAGRPVLRWVVDRLRRSERLDGLVVATSVAPQDDVIEDRCGQWGVPCFRGSEQDVLGRFVEAARRHDARWIVRINADNPLIDPVYVDRLLEAAADSQADYVSYRLPSVDKPVMLAAVSFFAEALSRDCLERADVEITDAFQREHVTLGIYTRPAQYDVKFLSVPSRCDDADLRLTLDTPEDIELLREIFEDLGADALAVGAEELVGRLDHRPQWRDRMRDLNARQPKRSGSGRS